jgi:C4-type Zn-finger protein
MTSVERCHVCGHGDFRKSSRTQVLPGGARLVVATFHCASCGAMQRLAGSSGEPSDLLRRLLGGELPNEAPH